MNNQTTAPTTEKEPLFSIITVTFNAATTVERTVASVASQSFRDYEHIIVDGASSDDTLERARSAASANNLRVISEPDRGIYDAMNKGIGLSRGKYLIFLNAGDKFHSARTLEKIAEGVSSNSLPGVVYGQTDLVDDNGAFVAPRHLTAPESLAYKDFARGMLVCHQAFVVLKRIAPLYNTDYRFSADYEWCIRCLQHSRKNVYINDVLIDYLEQGLTTANRRASLKERFSIMCYYFGTASTIMRHVGFAFRFMHNKFTHKPSD